MQEKTIISAYTKYVKLLILSVRDLQRIYITFTTKNNKNVVSLLRAFSIALAT